MCPCQLQQAIANERRPSALTAGLSLISTSYPSLFRHSMSLVSERFEKSPWVSADTFAWEIPICRAASCWVSPRRRTARVISIARPDLIFSSSASGSPRSWKTFPELISTSIPVPARLAISHLLCRRFGCLEPNSNGFHVSLRCANSGLALLLKAVQDEDDFLKAHRVN